MFEMASRHVYEQLTRSSVPSIGILSVKPCAKHWHVSGASSRRPVSSLQRPQHHINGCRTSSCSTAEGYETGSWYSHFVEVLLHAVTDRSEARQHQVAASLIQVCFVGNLVDGLTCSQARVSKTLNGLPSMAAFIKGRLTEERKNLSSSRLEAGNIFRSAGHAEMSATHP